MSFHLVSIINNQEEVIFHLAFQLDKDQDCTDMALRVFLSKNTEILGHTSKTWSAQLEVVL
uniref:Alternative protein SIM1 n=1 Tax=Homo sapiens TaxID=9606 RepID=L0R542_HUMAN|nr:alternative protein SIM1 [Homo sapiens]